MSTTLDAGPAYTCTGCVKLAFCCVKLAFCCVVVGCDEANGDSVTAAVVVWVVEWLPEVG